MANSMTDEVTVLSHEIRALLDEPSAADRELQLARLEYTLTAGYARALELEAERWRIERRLGQLVRDIEGDPREPEARELASLARRLAATDGSLTRLRRLLTGLKDRARELRAA